MFKIDEFINKAENNINLFEKLIDDEEMFSLWVDGALCVIDNSKCLYEVHELNGELKYQVKELDTGIQKWGDSVIEVKKDGTTEYVGFNKSDIVKLNGLPEYIIASCGDWDIYTNHARDSKSGRVLYENRVYLTYGVEKYLVEENLIFGYDEEYMAWKADGIDIADIGIAYISKTRNGFQAYTRNDVKLDANTIDDLYTKIAKEFTASEIFNFLKDGRKKYLDDSIVDSNNMILIGDRVIKFLNKIAIVYNPDKLEVVNMYPVYVDCYGVSRLNIFYAEDEYYYFDEETNKAYNITGKRIIEFGSRDEFMVYLGYRIG